MRLSRYRSTFALLLPCLLAGCYVKVDKSKNGEGKDVEVHLPVGGIHVQQRAPSAADIGLDSYPGATIVDEDDGHSADVNIGFGDWQMHLRVAKYQTPDPQGRVLSFYRNALARYGEVIECHDGRPVGSTIVTREGLGCSDKNSSEFKGMHIHDDDDELSLRAGSKRHQHIVAIKTGDGSGTRFTLLRLDLPAGSEESDKTE